MDFTVFSIVAKLKTKGYKATKTRTNLIDILLKSQYPLAASDIKTQLAKIGNLPNKTTVYRELEFLKSQGVVLEVQLGEDKKRYESAFNKHHHHLVCMRCDQIEDVVLENELDRQVSKIARNKQFQVINHSLEFFGLCNKCQ